MAPVSTESVGMERVVQELTKVAPSTNESVGSSDGGLVEETSRPSETGYESTTKDTVRSSIENQLTEQTTIEFSVR